MGLTRWVFSSGDLGPAAFPRKWIEQREDSHSLNMYSPPGAFQGTELLPVMVRPI